jgi:hypothetical protein
MNCSMAEARLAALLDGELPHAAERALRGHLERCERCAAALHEAAAAVRLADEWRTDGREVWAAVSSAIEREAGRDLAAEVRALRREVAALRAEIAELRATAEPTARGQDRSVLLAPYPRPDAAPLSVM